MKIRKVEKDDKFLLYVNGDFVEEFENVADCNEKIESISIIQCPKEERVLIEYQRSKG